MSAISLIMVEDCGIIPASAERNLFFAKETPKTWEN